MYDDAHAGASSIQEIIGTAVARLQAASSEIAQAIYLQEEMLERLAAEIDHEHTAAHDRVCRTSERRRFEIAQKLLSGEPTDPAELDELDYRLHDAWHVGVIATGPQAGRALRSSTTALGCELLIVSPESDVLWTWLGTPQKLAVADVERALAGTAGVSLVFGEARRGVCGWRLTHQEAQAALLVAMCRSQGLTRCADVPLEAAVLKAQTLASLLVETYVTPLENMHNGGKKLRETLRAYLAVGCNAATAAARLGVDRHTVERHVHAAEDSLGRPLRTCLPELHVALRLEELG